MSLPGPVLITGGSGSLGTAILERAHRDGWAGPFTVYSRDEVKQAALAERFPDVRFVLGDVQNADALLRAMRGIRTVVHAAAYKRVPEAERETVACVQTNVEGSLRVASAALAANVERVVAISTDKACSPINAYGQSKALMERLWQSFARLGEDTTYHVVRYGNVLASRGSVVPILSAQARRGEPLTLTDPDMSRFWLTLDDAVDLVVASLGCESGEVLIPDCHAATMRTVAEAIAPDAPIRVIGGRGGEKQHESLLNPVESPYARTVPMGWALRSLALPEVNELPYGHAYTSRGAPQLSALRLRESIASLMAGRPTRLLP